MDNSLFKKNYSPCICQCHFPATYCYHMECCCPCVYYVHETNLNKNQSLYNLNELHPIILSKKKKKKFNKEHKNIKHYYPLTPRNYINNNFSECDNQMNSFNTEQPKNLRPNTDIEEEENNNKNKPKYHNNENQEQKDKNINNNEEDKDNYHLFKKLKVNSNKQDRAITCPINSNINNKNKKKVMNNCIPINHNKISKPKYINKLELKNNIHKKKKRIFINKNSFDNINNNNNKLNLTNFENNFLSENKFKTEDQDDDIFDIKKQNNSYIENNENKIALQNLNNEIDKAKLMINNLKKENEDLNNLKSENEKLKQILISKEQKNSFNEQKVNKATNTSNYDNFENIKQENKEKDEKDLFQKKLFQEEIINLKNEISDITYKLNEYEKIIVTLKKKNVEQENIIENKDKEIFSLITRLGNIENENKNKLYELNIRNNEIMRENKNISSDLKINNDSLKLEVQKLKEILMNKNSEIKELEIKLKYEKNFDNKKLKLLEMLFNFYLNIKKVINFEKTKESLKEVIEVMNLDDFLIKLNKVEKKFTQIIDDIQIKYGHCFACDIACCTSHVDKLKTFRKTNPKKK